MFEAYTEKSRRSVFVGRREAVRLGSSNLEPDHLFLGLLEADVPLALRLFKSGEKVSEVRARVEREAPRNQESVTDVAPLSSKCKLVLAHATGAAESMKDRFIAPEHLILGILHESTSVAAQVMIESGITADQFQAELRQSVPVSKMAQAEGVRDLVAETQTAASFRLVGREKELEQIVQILSRRTRNSVVLVGEAGVGKEALVRGLAQRIADGDVPVHLGSRQILQVDAVELLRVFATSSAALSAASSEVQKKIFASSLEGGAILFVRGLFDLRAAMPLLAEHMKRGALQMIASSSPVSFRLAAERGDELARTFEMVSVLPPTDEEAAAMLEEAKGEFEKFHGVTIATEAVEAAIAASGRFIGHRPLPERALDLLDEAGARAKVRRECQPPQVGALKRRLKRLMKQMEHELGAYNFELAAKLSSEEKELRAKLERLEAEPRVAGNAVSADDIVAVVADRTGMTPEAVKVAMANPVDGSAESEIKKRVSARIPVGRRDWVDGLVAYLNDCSDEDAEHLSNAIRRRRAAG